MRMLRTLMPALLALALIGASVPAAAAQTDDPLQLEDIDGLQQARGRTYSADLSAVVDPATPEAASSGWYVLSAVIFAFDTEDHAAAALDLLMTEVGRSDFAGDDGRMEDVELDVDIDHVARRDVIEPGGLASSDSTVLVAGARDDTSVVLVLAMTSGDDPAPVVASTLTAIVETDPGEEPEAFHADGTSEGGLWSRFPEAETVQAEAPELVDVEDETIYPEASRAVATPARVRPVQVEGTPAG